MSDTPETDSYANRDWWTLFRANEHARKLERERDEAREKNEKLHDIAKRAINYLDQSYRDGFSDEVSDLRYELEQLKEETK
jgi:alkaline phosphatase